MPLPSERQLSNFLKRFTSEIQYLARSLLDKMRDLLPGAVQLVYENFNALIVGFGPSERASQAVLSLAIYPRWVNLCFLNGATLKDPRHLLQGRGKQVRTIRLDRAEAIDSPHLLALIEAAQRKSGVDLQDRKKSRVVIRAVAERTRDRRPTSKDERDRKVRDSSEGNAGVESATDRRDRKRGLRPGKAVAPRLRLEISAAIGKDLVPFLRKHLLAAHSVLKPPLVELSLALVGDKAMADLHQRFMGIAGPTDVLTFPLDEDARGRVTAGEVVVCIPEARRRAKAESTDVRREALLYALHGMLHLSGYDDLTPADYRKMHRMEDRILSAIGVGAVFERASKTGESDPDQSANLTATPRAKAKGPTAKHRQKKGSSRTNHAR